MLSGRAAARLGQPLMQSAAEHGWQIVAKVGMSDHVHLHVRVGLTNAPAEMVRAVTGRAARVLRHKFRRYVAADVGYVSASTVRRDIEHRWDAVAS